MTVLVTAASRAGARRLHADDGDYRDWCEIRCPATEVANHVASHHDTDSGTEGSGTDPGNGPIEERHP